MENIRMKAYAKINLTLDVLGKRPDGYHELSSVMQSIGLCDTLLMSKTPRQGIEIKTDCLELPVDEGNLVYRAAQCLLSAYKVQQGVFIELQKRIPIAAGLAGGSSDCAATLLGLNKLFELNIPQKRLFEIGRQLGADVPFCLMANEAGSPTTALAEGVGEQLTPLPSHPEAWIVLAHLPIMVSTKTIFSRWINNAASSAKSTDMVNAFATGNINEVASSLSNALAPVAMALHPKIDALMMALSAQNAIGVNMTGSGPTVFAYFFTETTALRAIEYIKQQFPDCDFFNMKVELKQKEERM